MYAIKIILKLFTSLPEIKNGVLFCPDKSLEDCAKSPELLHVRSVIIYI